MLKISRRFASTVNKNFDHCVSLVKNCDYENYMCLLMYPQDIIRSAFAIRAFNTEIANISFLSKTHQIALMRIQWWKERLNNVYSNASERTPLNEPIMSELELAIKTHDLSKHWLNRLITSREEQIKTKFQFKTMQDLELFGEQSVGSIYYLCLETLSIKNLNCDHVASHLAKSQQLANIVRSMPEQSKNKESLIPIDLLVKHKVSQNEIISSLGKQEITSNLKDLVYDICNASNQHLIKARSLKDKLPKESFILFINSLNIEHFLKSIEKHDFNIFDSRIKRTNSLMSLKLYLAKWRKIY